jgi:hypothetical protein
VARNRRASAAGQSLHNPVMEEFAASLKVVTNPTEQNQRLAGVFRTCLPECDPESRSLYSGVTNEQGRSCRTGTTIGPLESVACFPGRSELGRERNDTQQSIQADVPNC